MPGMLRLLLVAAIACLIAISSTAARGIPKDATSRVRRQMADIHLAAHLARLGMKERQNHNGCRTHGCGLIDFERSGRSRRANSDQRYGELQALIALSGGGDAAGHGVINPYAAGKKKRADDLVDAPSYSDIEVQKARLLKGMLEELAEQNLI